MSDAWKRAMHLKAEHTDSTYPGICDNDGNTINFDEESTVIHGLYGVRPTYAVRVGDDLRTSATADQVSRFLAERGVDPSKFE